MDNCYYHQDLYWRLFHLGSLPKASTQPPYPPTCMNLHCTYSQVSVPGFSAIHFRGSFIRQVSCYTLLSGFRLPWPPPCCLYETTPFMVSHEPEIRHLNLTFGSSHITSSAYQKWSTKDHTIYERGPSKRHPQITTHLKFENRLRLLQPQDL